LKPLDGVAAVELTPQIVFPMIDRLLGGSGQTLQTIRPMTEIEQSIMQKVLKLLVDNLKESWRPMHAVDFAVSSIENHPQMAQVVSSSEMVVRFTFQVRMRQTTAKMHLVFPTLVLAPVIQVSDQEWQSKKKVANDKTLLLQLPRIPVNVTIETGETRFPMQALLSLQAGDTLVLDQREEWPVQLKVSGRKKFQAAPKTGPSKKSFVISGHNRPVREEARDGSIS
jgi:flagellar motor switch protein FliM